MKAIMMAGIAVLAVALIAAGFAAASPMWQRDAGFHDIIEDGTFADLQEYRETTGRPVMSWVESEDDFAQMQEHHREMEAWHEENGAPGRGMMGGSGGHMMGGRGMGGFGRGGCPLHQ